MMKILSPLIVISLLLFSCKKDKAGGLSSFPFAIGHEWSYHCVSTINYSDVSKLQEKTEYDIEMKVTGDTLIDQERAFKVIFSYLHGTEVTKTTHYYVNRPDGTYLVAQDNPNGDAALILEEQPGKILQKDLLFPLIQSVNKLQQPAKLLMFPITLHKSWDSFPYLGMESEWVGYQSLTTPAGTFECAQ